MSNIQLLLFEFTLRHFSPWWNHPNAFYIGRRRATPYNILLIKINKKITVLQIAKKVLKNPQKAQS